MSTGQIQILKSGSVVATFSPSDLDTANSNANVALFQKGTINIGSTTLPKELLEIHVPQINGVSLSYTRFGTYEKTNVSILTLSGSLDPLAAFVFGQPTSSGMPVSGSATYTSDLFGVVAQESGSTTPNFYTLGNGNGSATFSANFGSGTVSTLINLNSSGGNFGTLNGSGSITSGGPAFNGTLTGAASGGFTGAFFGPGAIEMGYVFQAQGSNFVTYGNVFGKNLPPP